ncbi:MAG: tannase/feruloyl esterase family alpha/beta hydrolase [Acidisphaera sp.]|nr:tannase/feruloyl esterase family alpha/beta hydrolase [Acidisphaera sp.]
MRLALPAAGCVLAAAAFGARPASAAVSCSNLAQLMLPNVTITSSAAVTPPFLYPGEPASGAPVSVPFCRVQAVATPTGSSGIHFEVWLPPAGTWNGKFRGEGSGGSAGSISYSAMVDAVQRNYATMANDNGHTGSNWTFSQNPYSVIDFGYRAQHVTTVDAKQIVDAFYGRAPQHSYFVGCSQGGHHAQMEAQRYPTDYDGIIGGDPASDWTGQMFLEVWVGLHSDAGGTPLPQTQLNLVTNAVLAQCAGQDGGLSTDKFLTDPRDCHFNPAVLQCATGQDPSTCLTATQVADVKAIWQGPYDTITGQKIAPGLAVGSETFWRQVLVGGTVPGGSSDSFFVNGIFDDPNYNFANFNFGTDVALTNDKVFAGQTAEEILDANNTNLEPFRQAGGKIIMYHGWADPFVASQFSIDLYAGIIEHNAQAHGLPFAFGPLLEQSFLTGGSRYLSAQRLIARILALEVNDAALKDTQKFARLFMVPGMNHCAGGPGANVFGGVGQPDGTNRTNDMVDALDAWVTQGIAPTEIVATKYNNDTPSQGVAFSRPLCPYPQMAVYKGSGDQTSAASFSCAADEPDNNGPPILGINSYPNGSP